MVFFLQDLFRMRSLTINSKKGRKFFFNSETTVKLISPHLPLASVSVLGGTSETAEQSIISLADSASNFDEHVGDEAELDYELEQSAPLPESLEERKNYVVGGYHFGRQRQADFVPNQNTGK